MTYLQAILRLSGRAIVRQGRSLITAGSGYDAAGGGRRARGWDWTSDDQTSLVSANLETLRGRCRQQVRENPWISGAVDEWVSECLGTGLKFQSLHPDPGIKRGIQDVFERWSETADPLGLSDFGGLQALCLREVIEAGECLARFRRSRPSDGLPVPFQLQLLEGDHLPASKTEQGAGGGRIRAGIELDEAGRRRAYHLLRDHPGSDLLSLGGSETDRVPIRDVLHVLWVKRAGQLRGVPWITPALIRMFELDRWEDAEVVRKKVAAMFVGFYRDDGAQGLFDKENPDGSLAETGLEPGTWKDIGNGHMDFHTPPRDSGSDWFPKWSLRSLARGLGLTAEQVTGDLSEVNYSSIRAGLVSQRRKCRQLQAQLVIHQFANPTARRVIEEAALAGALEGVSVRRFDSEREAFLSFKWHSPRWEWVDPEKEVNATVTEIRNGLKSWSQAVEERGLDPEEVAEAYRRDRELLDRMGLTFDSDPRLAGDPARAEAAARRRLLEAAAEAGGAEVIQ